LSKNGCARTDGRSRTHRVAVLETAPIPKLVGKEKNAIRARRIEKAAHSGFPEGGSREVTSDGHIGEPLPD
jgi:hypothetical protein